MSYFFVSAAHKSSGKTTISIGITAALTRQGIKVQTFKKGPDYIDPLWLKQASGRDCQNLDFYTSSIDNITQSFQDYRHGSDMALIEGNKGLYDGIDLLGSDSNAGLAELLDAPVVLVLDTQGITRGIAPLILGYQSFTDTLNIRGVILNRVGGARHESKLREVIEHYTDVPVLGAVANDIRLNIDERHLGLVPSNEEDQSHDIIGHLADAVTEQIDLAKIIEVSQFGNKYPIQRYPRATETKPDIRIAVAQDEAFGFYYSDDLKTFVSAGAEIIPFSPINDSEMPDADGLFLGGGFPETHLDALSTNRSMLRSIKEFIEDNKPTYAECGGLMYLSRQITWNGQTCKTVGAIDADCHMHTRPKGRGYVKLIVGDNHPWAKSGDEINAHEFHYSTLENISDDTEFAFTVKRGVGITGSEDGIMYKRLLANYTHQRTTGNNTWVMQFVSYVRRVADEVG